MPMPAGTRLGPYEILAPIGAGGMGEVFCASDTRLNRMVAIKVLSKHLQSDPGFEERFRREAQAIAALSHPNIVTIHDIGQEAGVCFMVMEFVDGETLRGLVARGSVGFNQLVDIGVQIADALSAVHSLGLLHRDVNPANILVTPAGVAKLMDFGIAKRLIESDDDTAAALTFAGDMVGTLHYMSPEQARGLPLDARSDVFSLGSVLYEAATGELPFRGHGALDTLLAITTLEPMPPRRLRPTLPPAFESLVLHALMKDKQARLSSAAALRDGLRLLAATDNSRAEQRQRGRPPRGLPAPLTRLVGREQELAAACQLLRRDDVRLLNCTGPAGVGKTRLAVEIARATVDDFMDGVVFVSLEAIRQPDEVLFELTKALQLREEDARTTRQLLVDHVSDKQLLLVLDNFEHVIDAAPLLTDLLAVCPRLKVLVTSRALLRIQAEHLFTIPPLQTAADETRSRGIGMFEASSIALFLDRARVVRPDLKVTEETLVTIAEICSRLDGLPLAIELAAARTRVLAPKQLLRRIEKRLHGLGPGMRDVPVRQQTLRGAIDWSYELLDESERKLFRRLAVFVGGATLDSVETISAPDNAVLDAMSSLVDNNLLRRMEDVEGDLRIDMLETIREYALERLEASGEADEVRLLYARHYLDLAEQVDAQLRESEQGPWLDQLEAEYANCRSASEWFLSTGHVEEAFRVLLALWRFWEIRGYWTEGRMQFERLLLLTRQSVSPTLRARALYAAGVLADAQSDFRAARESFEQHLVIQRAVADPRALASAINNLGVVAMRQGDYTAAETFHLETLEIVRGCGLESSEAASLNNLGHVARCRGDLAGARSRYLESLAISQRSGNLRAAAWTLSNLADVSSEESDVADAELRYSQSLTLFQKIDDKTGQASCMADLGNLACRTEHFGLAASLYQESLVLFGDLGDRRGIVRVLEGFAILSAARHRPAATLRLAAVAAAVRKSLGAQTSSSHSTNLTAVIESARSMAGLDADRLWAEGGGMPLERAMQYALESAVS